MTAPPCPGRTPPRAGARVAAIAAASAVLAAVLTTGCATRSTEVAAQPANPAQFAGWSCARIDDEAERVQRRAAEVAWAVDERSGNNIVALGVGVMVFWPALLALRPEGQEAEDLARLMGRFEALRAASALARCPPPSAELPPARAAALPVAPGDRLVYEERPTARQAAIEQRWTVRALRRDEIEYTRAAPPASGAAAGSSASVPASAPAPTPATQNTTLRHDPLGNVLAGDPGALVWPQLLRGELALGQVTAGEIRVVGDPLVRARVRAQVVAVGPQQVDGRRFEAAVLELFGDVLTEAPGATRLDGVLVVDRNSGVLLRLDLRSSQAPFRLMRRLVHVER
jgi:hypothetical protein